MAKYTNQSELIKDFDQLLGRFIRTFETLQGIVGLRIKELGMGTSEPIFHLETHVSSFLHITLSKLSFRSKLTILETLLHTLRARPEYPTDKPSQLVIEKEI
jgi:hypothetical protein